jgi:GntR family transcriptional regulator/MocR family aminotransferase
MSKNQPVASTLSAEALSELRLDNNSPLPKVRQLYLNLYRAIENGQLPFDTRLPSSRDLSLQLGLGRNTVISVYDQLVSEGMLSANGRLGTRVARQVTPRTTATNPGVTCSKRSRALTSRATQAADLAPGEPDTRLFPQAVWRKAQAVAARKAADHLGYRSQALTETREAIARYLANYRSLHVEPEQIVVTSGTRQSLNLAAALFTDPGDVALVECPGYNGGVDAFRQWGLTVRPARIDQGGMIIPATEPPNIVYTTPCFQYPFGMPLAADRRQSLLALARDYGTIIFEDDYDSEFRDDTQPRPSLASDADGATVLNAGTFSKLLFPAIRVGWLVVPPTVVNEAYLCLKALGGGNNTISQLVVSELLNNGSIARHLRHARQIYGQRRQALITSLSDSPHLEPIGQVSGSLSLVLTLTQSLSITALEQALAKQQLGAAPLERLNWQINKPSKCKSIVVGLGNVETLSIPQAVRRLNKALRAAAEG